MNIVEICIDEVKKAEAKKVTGVELEIGTMSGIESDALEFSWDVAINNSILEGAGLIIHKIEATARCVECGTEFVMEDVFGLCPSCGKYRNEILSGKELRIKAITIE